MAAGGALWGKKPGRLVGSRVITRAQIAALGLSRGMSVAAVRDDLRSGNPSAYLAINAVRAAEGDGQFLSGGNFLSGLFGKRGRQEQPAQPAQNTADPLAAIYRRAGEGGAEAVVRELSAMVPGSTTNVRSAGDMGDARAGYEWRTDTVLLSELVSTVLGEGARRGGLPPELRPHEIRAVHSVLHELEHSASPAGSRGEYDRFWEEGLVEHRSRARTRALYGEEPDMDPYPRERQAVAFIERIAGPAAVEYIWQRSTVASRQVEINLIVGNAVRSQRAARGAPPISESRMNRVPFYRLLQFDNGEAEITQMLQGM